MTGHVPSIGAGLVVVGCGDCDVADLVGEAIGRPVVHRRFEALPDDAAHRLVGHRYDETDPDAMPGPIGDLAA